MADERWEGDETGSGISDGEAFAAPLRALLEEMSRPDWNTEDPEAHLLPHLQRRLASGDRLALTRFLVDDDVLELVLETRANGHSDLRELVYPLIAAIAEPTTVIVERRDPGEHVFEVTLAVAPGQGDFPKGHGHLVRFRIAGEA